MTRYRGTYINDLGQVQKGASLNTRFLVEADRNIPQVDESSLIPPVFFATAEISRLSSCPLVVTPRRVLMYLDVDRTFRFEMPIPFIGGSPEYVQFRDQIAQNPLILAYDILAESIRPQWMRLWL